jgi:hypothetical protein
MSPMTKTSGRPGSVKLRRDVQTAAAVGLGARGLAQRFAQRLRLVARRPEHGPRLDALRAAVPAQQHASLVDALDH